MLQHLQSSQKNTESFKMMKSKEHHQQEGPKRSRLIWDLIKPCDKTEDLFSGISLFSFDEAEKSQVPDGELAKAEDGAADGGEGDEGEKDQSRRGLTCRTCGVETFGDVSEQRSHFKSGWHRYNLLHAKGSKRATKGAVVTEEEYAEMIDRANLKGDDSDLGLSGSESEPDSDDDDGGDATGPVVPAGSPRVLFRNDLGLPFSLYKCLLFSSARGGEQDVPDGAVGICRKASALTERPQKWAILLLGGGHFAGAVFSGKDVEAHKTFHSYTVRKKQGGGQSAADSKSGTSHPRSAGSSLRRYNEASFAQHVKDILAHWWEETRDLQGCDAVFFRATSGNKKVLMDGFPKGALDKIRPILRSIPFPTRRATFKEVRRIHLELATVQVGFDRVVDSRKADTSGRNNNNSPAKAPKASKVRRSKSRDLPEKGTLLPQEVVPQDRLEGLEGLEDDHEGGLAKGPPIPDEGGPDEDAFRLRELDDTLVTASKMGDQKLLMECILSFQEASLERKPDLDLVAFLSQKFGGSGTSPLHLAAEMGRSQVVGTLLAHGADPTLKNRDRKTPYNLAADKPTRNAFRRFQAQFPDQHDWAKANLPTADLLTPEAEARMEEARRDKKKAQRRAKKDKEAQRKLEAEAQDAEQRDREAFLRLSDREKRALAAERRILLASSSSSGSGPVVLERCFNCAVDVTGKIPFEYDRFRFCSTSCVKDHRQKNVQAS